MELYFLKEQVEHKFEEELESHHVDETALEPRFDGGLCANLDFSVHVTPEVNLAARIGFSPTLMFLRSLILP